jgi:lipoprotein-releasing system permease protein
MTTPLVFELAWRFVQSSLRSQLAVTTKLSLTGFVLGTASLVVAMAVVSGFEQTLFESVARLNGHIQIRRTFSNLDSYREFKKKLQNQYPNQIRGITPVLWVEALAIHKGATQGVLLQGLDVSEAKSLLDFLNVLKGDGNLKSGQIWIGSGIAKRWGLKNGDKLSLVVPISDELNPQKLKRSFKVFEVCDIVSLGKYEYDERAVILNLSDLQELAQIGTQLSGALIQTNDRDWAKMVKADLQSFLGSLFRVQTWYDINSYLFEAIQIERYVIFFVILIIVIASSFNVGVSLWIGVLQRTRELALLKSLGLSGYQTTHLMLIQGFILSLLGAGIGLGIGISLSFGVDWIQTVIPLLPGSVYKIDHLRTQILWSDLAQILISVVILSGAAVYWPARNAARQRISEGLRYE